MSSKSKKAAAAATEEKDDEKDDEMGTYTPSQIDIDAIASAKSLGTCVLPGIRGLGSGSGGVSSGASSTRF